MVGDHFLQKYFSIVSGFVGQPLFQLFTVQMDHCEVGFCWEADNLLRHSTKLLHLLKKAVGLRIDRQSSEKHQSENRSIIQYTEHELHVLICYLSVLIKRALLLHGLLHSSLCSSIDEPVIVVNCKIRNKIQHKIKLKSMV